MRKKIYIVSKCNTSEIFLAIKNLLNITPLLVEYDNGMLIIEGNFSDSDFLTIEQQIVNNL